MKLVSSLLIPVFPLASPRADPEANQITIHFVDRRDARQSIRLQSRKEDQDRPIGTSGIAQNEEVE